MKTTEEVIDVLVRDLRPVQPANFRQLFLCGTAVGLMISLGFMLAILGLRPDLAAALSLPVFWVKSAYNLLLAIAAYLAVYRLSRPDGTRGRVISAAALIAAAMSIAALTQLWNSPPNAYSSLIIGSSSLHCPFLIVAFAVPLFLTNTWILRQSAPTNLRLTSALSGLAAGAAGAWVYSWFCTENGMPFVLIWYSLGIALCGFIGGISGGRLLRW